MLKCQNKRAKWAKPNKIKYKLESNYKTLQDDSKQQKIMELKKLGNTLQ